MLLSVQERVGHPELNDEACLGLAAALELLSQSHPVLRLALKSGVSKSLFNSSSGTTLISHSHLWLDGTERQNDCKTRAP